MWKWKIWTLAQQISFVVAFQAQSKKKKIIYSNDITNGLPRYLASVEHHWGPTQKLSLNFNYINLIICLAPCCKRETPKYCGWHSLASLCKRKKLPLTPVGHTIYPSLPTAIPYITVPTVQQADLITPCQQEFIYFLKPISPNTVRKGLPG